MTDKALTVSELTDRIKSIVEETIGVVNVIGEISTYQLHSSGHRYFTLKDESAQLKCVYFRWKAESLTFEPKDGMSVVAAGKLTVYKPQGSYQLDVNRLFPAGIGALEMAFREMKERLFKEGLFDSIHKKSLPEFPLNVGVVTSSTGAAIQDFIRILHNRSPWINIIIRPTRVQGEGAAQDIANAIAELNDYGMVDVIVITRGGGSLEDLWAFNEEIVARAVFASEIPVVSAVGHEIDFTICDFVADVRAATPTAAAELISKDGKALYDNLDQMRQSLYESLIRIAEANKMKMKMLVHHKAFGRPVALFEQATMKLDHIGEKLIAVVRERNNSHKFKIESLGKRLNSVSPQNILRRGYSVCATESNEIIKNSSQLNIGDAVKLKFAEGGADGNIKRVYSEKVEDGN